MTTGTKSRYDMEERAAKLLCELYDIRPSDARRWLASIALFHALEAKEKQG